MCVWVGGSALSRVTGLDAGDRWWPQNSIANQFVLSPCGNRRTGQIAGYAADKAIETSVDELVAVLATRWQLPLAAFSLHQCQKCHTAHSSASRLLLADRNHVNSVLHSRWPFSYFLFLKTKSSNPSTSNATNRRTGLTGTTCSIQFPSSTVEIVCDGSTTRGCRKVKYWHDLVDRR